MSRKLEAVPIKDIMGHTRHAVGVYVGSMRVFAWTEEKFFGEQTENHNLTHVPTGGVLYRHVRISDARALAMKFESLLPDSVLHDEDSGRFVTAIQQKTALYGGVHAWLQSILLRPKRKKKSSTTPKEVLLSSPYWKDAVIVKREWHMLVKQSGTCKNKDCKKDHHILYGARTKSVDRRHYEKIMCLRVEHPSGAVAWLRES